MERVKEPDLRVQTVTWEGLTWHNIEKPTLKEMEWLKETYGFHPLDMEDCLSKIQLPKLDEYPEYIFLVVHFPLFNKLKRLTQPSEVDIFAGPNYVVTIHSGELKPLLKLFQDCQQSDLVRESIMSQGSGYLLYRILDTLVDYCFPILNKIIDNVDQVEGRLFETGHENVVLRELALLRRDILAYRRIVRPQIDVLERLEKKRFPFLKLESEIYFGDLSDHMRRLRTDLEDQEDEVGGLHESFNSLASHRANEITRIFTVLAALAVPILVVTSLYGMNIKLPLQESSSAFAILGGASFLVTVLLLAYAYLRRWL